MWRTQVVRVNFDSNPIFEGLNKNFMGSKSKTLLWTKNMKIIVVLCIGKEIFKIFAKHEHLILSILLEFG